MALRTVDADAAAMTAAGLSRSHHRANVALSPPMPRMPMDPLSDVLSLLKPQSYAFRGLDAGGRWAIDFPPGTGIKCYALTAGQCWLWVDGGDAPVALAAGDCVLLPRGHAFRFGSDAEAPARDALELFPSVGMGDVVTVNGGGGCTGVGGYFDFIGPHADLLLRILPPVIHLRSEADKAALRLSIERLMQELRDPQPGGALLAEHLAQTLLIQALRLHIADGSAQGVGWLFALADRRMCVAITAMHAEPGKRWTLDALASHVGMSRSSFAARFKATVGEPAMEYLTRWRMLTAADRLTRGDATVATVAFALGYESESAFSVAFKRVIGCSPGRYGRGSAEQDKVG